MKRFLIAAAALTALMLPQEAAQATELKFNNWMPPRSLEGVILPKFSAEVEKATGGSLKIKIFHGGQLLSGPATLAGLRDGVADIGFIVPTLTPAELKHITMIPDLLPFATDGFASGAAADETIMVGCPECRKELDDLNVVWLGGYGASPWYLVCREPISSFADLKNRKSRVTGGTATRMMQAFNMVGVQMAPPEIAQALQGRQIDCTVGPIDWMQGLRLNETVKVIVDMPLGNYHGLGLYVFNKASLAKMTPAERTALQTLLPKFSAELTAAYNARIAEVFDDAKKRGIAFWTPTPDFVAAYDKFKAGERAAVAADMQRRGVQNADRLVALHLANLEKWHIIAKGTGYDQAKMEQALRDNIYSKLKN